MSDQLKIFQWVSGCFVPAATSSPPAGQSLDTQRVLLIISYHCLDNNSQSEGLDDTCNDQSEAEKLRPHVADNKRMMQHILAATLR